MDVDLEVLIADAERSGWAPGPSRRLADGIEARIVVPLSSRLRTALGSDEAAQLARVIAWERCLELAIDRPEAGVSWGYLANLVRWRLQDAVRAEVIRRRRHLLTQRLPDGEAAYRPVLGHHLDRIALELASEGLSPAAGRRFIRAAADGPPFYRAGIAARVRRAGATRSQAEALAWLLRGGAGQPSALARLAVGESPGGVFADPVVRRWILAVAGRDQRFFGRPSRLGHRQAVGVEWLQAA
ncbi:hypothetical protein [Kribbella speibonae]|uniref:Uncharacterized protein n=1 Tax=Kribbella speibonae TaxID=1572660 RepID=A0A4R0IXR6_9ACTN|nr:hypothetical protein [Kribbella speibonae]TCC36486.1 hypothetical protein E0H92_28065 [Kribbella speibonae]